MVLEQEAVSINKQLEDDMTLRKIGESVNYRLVVWRTVRVYEALNKGVLDQFLESWGHNSVAGCAGFEESEFCCSMNGETLLIISGNPVLV